MADAAPMFQVPPHPGASSMAVSRRMSTLPRRDNAVELAVRRLLHASGLRYRVAFPVPGWPRRSIDIAFPKAKVAVFIDGCYWHSCPEHGTQPTSNSEWWRAKLAANRARDVDTTEHLELIGWTVIRVWEHEPPASSALLVRAAVGRLTPGRPREDDQTRGRRELERAGTDRGAGGGSVELAAGDMPAREGS